MTETGGTVERLWARIKARLRCWDAQMLSDLAGAGEVTYHGVNCPCVHTEASDEGVAESS